MIFNENSLEPLLGPFSIRETFKILGVSKDIVPRYLNINKYFKRPALGIKVRVQKLESKLIDKPIIHRAKINLSKINYDVSSLSLGKYFIIEEGDNNSLLISKPIEGFNSIKKIVKFLDPDKFENYQKQVMLDLNIFHVIST
jgi:hypothetical protein